MRVLSSRTEDSVANAGWAPGAAVWAPAEGANASRIASATGIGIGPAITERDGRAPPPGELTPPDLGALTSGGCISA